MKNSPEISFTLKTQCNLTLKTIHKVVFLPPDFGQASSQNTKQRLK